MSINGYIIGADGTQGAAAGYGPVLAMDKPTNSVKPEHDFGDFYCGGV